ncbi:PucR family transcriptional regulator [Clostridium tarantellae]|uniref:PucR family transcriptional regulator n=1 Tax=Clostridium tarantellae TaxID=39493 RepID=A0A6I1MM43_9CLOT|nr:PucR family transcriptional regulator [Clostridium tarantellae]MPQ43508.1 hypothetical protein [Clostridium tarantellae]
MIVKCEDLIELSFFKDIKLVAGKDGLNRNVSWPYVGQTNSVSEWVHGGELLFITGMGMNVSTKNLIELLKECVLKNLSGLVILTGSTYIKSIPKELIEVANNANFPLFEMPWQIKLIDVTKHIANYIILKESEKRKESSFLGKLLFSDHYNSRINVNDLVDMHRININETFFIGVFNIKHNYTDNMSSKQDYMQTTIDNLCKDNNIIIFSLLHGDNIICLISSKDNEEAKNDIEYMKVIKEILVKKYTELDIYLSLGRIYMDIYHAKKSYEEAMKALKLYKESGMKERIIEYSKLGIYRLLFEIDNLEEVKSYHDDILGELIAYDKVNNTKFLHTITQYLFNNCNLIKTSQVMFIHRNTLIYRLNKIKNILNKDLEDPMDRLELLNAIMISNYLASQE